MAADLAEIRMNVVALKRVDPYFKAIIGTATQVALYTFSPLKNEWEKTDVEGALFVYSRNGEPFHSILIMNRLNTNNLVEPLIKDLDWQMQAPFLLYRNSRNSIYGIWFYNRDECVKITFLLETIMESINKQEKSKKTASGGADIFSLLSKAQENFNKTPVKTEGQPQALNITPQSVMDFFAKVSTTTTQHQAPARVPTGDGEPLKPLLHRLMSNPAHSVEHIEKQQRAVTPQEQKQNLSLLKNQTNQENTNRNSGIFNLQSVSPVQLRDSVNTSNISTPLQSCSVNVDKNNTSVENGLNFMRISSPINIVNSPRGNFYGIPNSDDTQTKSLSPPLVALLDTPQKPALMPPRMFAHTGNKEIVDNVLFPFSKPVECPEVPEPLTRKQMLQAFNYLLKNDPDFVTKLHEAYVKSFTEMVS